MRRGLIAALLILLLLGSLAPAWTTPAVRASERTWASLGPEGVPVSAVLPSPAFASDRTLFVLGGRALWRWRDGEWTRLFQAPAEVAIGPAALSPAFSSDGTIFLQVGGGLWRSQDGGATWRQLMADTLSEPATIWPSPSFASDGLVFLLHQGRLWRGESRGERWIDITPLVGDQSIQRVVFSPAFASDRTIFAAVVSAPFPGVEALSGNEPSLVSAANERSAGILVSSDAGLSWQPLFGQPEIEGVPYRHVFDLAVSPAFPNDPTLFAYTWGPQLLVRFDTYDRRTGPGFSDALFRSDDAGDHWSVLRATVPRGGAPFRQWARIALSPRFGRGDRIVYLLVSSASATPASHGCSLLRSSDGGGSWSVLRPARSYESCQDFVLSPLFPAESLVWLRFSGSEWSWDGGFTWWGQLAGGGPEHVTSVVFSPTYEQDRTLFAATPSGVWAYGPPDLVARPLPRCDLPPILGFGVIWRQEPGLATALGCPTSPERAVGIDEWQDGQGGRYWRLPQIPGWSFHLRADGMAFPLGDERRASGPPFATYNGTAQSYERGWMVWRKPGVGPRRIVAIFPSGAGLRWLERDDPLQGEI